ncbi:hypothetical protein CO652_31750 [Rhizobium sp. H4]|nr:hypothetical protein CO652_31750 [Rhizobium sp. H4]
MNVRSTRLLASPGCHRGTCGLCLSPYRFILAQHSVRSVLRAVWTILLSRSNSTNISRSCQYGNCGTCKTKLSIGRDQSTRYLLTACLRDTTDGTMVCVSHAAD